MTFHGPELHWYWMSDPEWLVWQSCWNNYWIIKNFPIVSYYLILFIYQYHCMAKIQLRTLLFNNYETHPTTTFHSIEHLQLVSARVASVVVKMPASTVYLVGRIWDMKGSAQLMQTKSRMSLTHPSATAFATSSVKTSLPSTSCTLSPFHCWCIAEEGTSKADF